jgi:hypothetical protein
LAEVDGLEGGFFSWPLLLAEGCNPCLSSPLEEGVCFSCGALGDFAALPDPATTVEELDAPRSNRGRGGSGRRKGRGPGGHGTCRLLCFE